MEIVDRYIHAVTRRLPDKQKGDIEKELRSLIADMMEERLEKGEQADQAANLVLRELGDPGGLAMKYRGWNRHLIGPELFPSYLSVLRIAAVAMGVVVTLSFFIKFLIDPASVDVHFGEFGLSLLNGAFQVFTWVTIVFALIDYGKGNAWKGMPGKKAWSPAELEPIRSPVKRLDVGFGIAFSIVVAVICTVQVDALGMYFIRDDHRGIVPFFDQEIVRHYLPLIWALTVLTIGRDSLKLVTREWTMKLIVVHIAVNVISLIAFAYVLTQANIWNPHFMEGLAEMGIVQAGTEGYENADRIWSAVTDRFLYLMVIITVLDTISVLYKGFRSSSALKKSAA